MPVETGRDILEGWSTDRAAKETYKTALEEMRSEWQGFRADMQTQISDIRETLQAEREAHKKELRKAKRPGLGFFGGIGYTTNGDVEGVAGIGLVYKVW